MGESISLEQKVEELSARVAELSRKVDSLTGRMEAASARASGPAGAFIRTESDASEELLSWVGKSSLLQRLSTLCFLLVIALILRTVTDARLIDLQIGSIIGMGYAALLMFLGWRRYVRNNPLAPIFTICGAVLMFTIVVETHAHFESLPSVPAYILLMLTGLGMAALSHYYLVPAPISVGTLGMCLAGAAIDYPHPFFPYLGGLLLTANLLGHLTARAHRYSWLRWILLAVTMFMIHLWGFKLGVALLNKDPLTPQMAPFFFLPILVSFALVYPAMAFLRIRGSDSSRIARFDLLVPTLNVIWAFTLTRYVVFAMGENKLLLGSIGVLAGLGHMALAWWHAESGPAGVRGANAFMFAGAVLLALAVPVATGSALSSLPFLSLTALFFAVVSQRWESGSIRLSSYVLQIYAASALAFLRLSSTPDASVLEGTLVAALLACIGLLHYKRCRASKPPAASAFFSKFDKRDFSAVSLLLASLVSAFFMLRIVAHQVLVLLLPAEAVDNAFGSAQSVIINVSAAVLMLFALAHRKKEVRNVAVLVTVIGAVKVFLYDLFGGMHGMPIVVSVFSFGLATALESFGLSRWHHLAQQTETERNDSA